MDPILSAILGIILFMFLSFNGLPVAFSFAIVGTVGLILFRGLEQGLYILVNTPFSWGTEANLVCLPLFVLMGQFAFYSKISEDLYITASKWMGRLPGGIALATTLASTGFAACCGVSMAGTATLGAIAYPEMKKFRYSDRLATGCIVAGGGLSTLIPPSLGFIFYGFLTETSIADLFIAAIFPGLMLASMFLLLIYVMCKINTELGPPGKSYPLREMLTSLRGIAGMLILVIIVMGGLYAGVFTPSEAGAAGAFGAFVIALVTRRVNLSKIAVATQETMRTSCFILTLIIGANIFNTFISVTGLTSSFSEWMLTLEMPRYAILICILLVYIPLGMFLEMGAMILLTVPIFIPPLRYLGFDPVWMGILIGIIAEMGFMTPPVGMNAFVVHGVTKVPLVHVFRGILPFALIMIIGTVLILIFPQIALFLPTMMAQ